MASITATFGTVEYREGGVIAIPLNFAADVIVPSKSICRVTRVSGSDLTGVNYRIIGKERAFEVVVEVPPDRKGSFSVAMIGTVLNTSTQAWDTVTVDALSPVNYDTRIPRIVDYDIPENYTIGEKFDVKIAFNTIVTGIHQNNIESVFILEGANLGTPDPYRWIGSGVPNIKADVPATIPSTEWEALATPPGGPPTPESNGFDADGHWHGVELQYLLVRFQKVPTGTTGIFNMTLREAVIRGAVS